jgi:uncharacterized cupredoxin-like copper-binding protein
MVKTFVVTLAVLLAFALPRVVWGAGAQQLTITMDEYAFTPEKITLEAGVPVEVTLVNKGTLIHDLAVYAVPKPGLSGPKLSDWAAGNSYFSGLEVSVAAGPGIEVVRKGPNIVDIKVAAGKSTTLKFTPVKKGTFEAGCLSPGHYEASMKGTWTVK